MRLTQRVAEIEGKIIAFVETSININGEWFRVTIDKQKKPLYNYICKNYGFVIGELKNGMTVEEKVIEI